MLKIGLALSGGGARGIAHLGLLCAMEELGLRPSVISGVSAGAIAGALYAAGYPPRQILSLAQEHASGSLVRLALFQNGLFSSSGLRHLVKTYLPADSFGSLRIPLLVTATDIISGKSVTLSEGPLCDALLGSAAVPGLFSPVKYGNYSLVDGGVLNNFPVEGLQKSCNKIIGSHVNKLDNSRRPEQLGKLYVIEKCFHLAIASTIIYKSALCDVFLEPALEAYSMFDMKHADKIFEAGYQAAMEQKDIFLSWGEEDEIKDDQAHS